jgi:hypothetical protein
MVSFAGLGKATELLQVELFKSRAGNFLMWLGFVRNYLSLDGTGRT